MLFLIVDALCIWIFPLIYGIIQSFFMLLFPVQSYLYHVMFRVMLLYLNHCGCYFWLFVVNGHWLAFLHKFCYFLISLKSVGLFNQWDRYGHSLHSSENSKDVSPQVVFLFLHYKPRKKHNWRSSVLMSTVRDICLEIWYIFFSVQHCSLFNCSCYFRHNHKSFHFIYTYFNENDNVISFPYWWM